VRLSGTVHTMMERARAENAAWSAPGVSKVVNQIDIGA
jgi:osmotically-inducible protein OsmY